MKNFFIKFGIFFYRLSGSFIIFLAIFMSMLYYLLPIFVSTDKVKATVLQSINLPIQFERVEWGVWGLSPTIVIRHASLYQQEVKKITIELDWVAWLKTDKIQVKKIFFKKANLKGQYREDKIYLDDLAEYAILFNQDSESDGFPIKELVLIDSHIVLRNELNQLFETKHTNINLSNDSDSFILDVKGQLAKQSAPFEFGLGIHSVDKTAKVQMYIAGKDIDLADLQFFFKDILISGEAQDFSLWLEGEWSNFQRLVAKGDINNFGYFYENRKLFYPYISGQFGIEWKPDATEYLGKNISLTADASESESQFYVNIPNKPSYMTLLAKDFPLIRLDNIFNVFLADKPGLTEWWQTTLPRGQLDYLNTKVPDIADINGHDLLNLLSDLSGEIIVRDLKLNKNPFHFSGDNFTKIIGYYYGDRAKFTLQGENTLFQESHYYPEGVKLDNITGTVWYWRTSDNKTLYFDDTHGKSDKAKFNYEAFWKKDIVSNTWETEGQFFEENFEVKQFLSLIPKNLLDQGLSDWLNRAIVSGELLHARGVIRGKLNDFPYARPSTGLVEADVVVNDATIQYQQNWPELKNADGAVDLDGPKLNLYATEGEIAQSTIQSAKAAIPNIDDANPQLILDAKVSSTFTKTKEFIDHSPLKEVLTEKLNPINITGPVDVLLDLRVPLNVNSPDQTYYRGLLDFEKAKVKIPALDLKISALNGSIFFSPRGISGHNLSGTLFGMPTAFTIASDVLATDPRLKVSAKGQIEIAKLNEWFSLANSDLIGGKTGYTANLFLKHTAKDTEGELKIQSDLTGITVNLPEPFQKKSSEKEDFDLNVQFAPSSKIQMQMKYADKIDLIYELKTIDKSWVPQTTQVTLGKKPDEASGLSETSEKSHFFSENPFSVEGYLDSLDLSEWQKVLSENNSNAFSSNFFVRLKVKKLKAFGQDFENMTLQVSPSGISAREISILGDGLKGKVTLPLGACTSSIKADFEYLSFPKNNEKEPKSTLNAIKTKAGNCPIEVNVKKLDLDKKVIESVYLHLIPQENGFILKNIRAKAEDTNLQASGFWTLTPKSQIDLKGIIQTKDIHDTLKAGGIESTLHAATGQIRFDLNWEKDLTDIDLSTINGEVTVFLRNGYIKGAEPGIGRILSLLSVDNLLRRLQLDFSDVAKEGLAMDKLTASFHFHEGVMKTDDLVLDSPAARVELLGEAVLNTKKIEGTVKVMPKITGSLPIAAAIAAGNPAVGAVVWMADKVLGRTIQEITHYQYQLSGTLDKPKLVSKNDKK